MNLAESEARKYDKKEGSVRSACSGLIVCKEEWKERLNDYRKSSAKKRHPSRVRVTVFPSSLQGPV